MLLNKSFPVWVFLLAQVAIMGTFLVVQSRFGGDNDKEVVTKTVVVHEALVDTIIRNAEGKVSFIERLTTVELKPDTVYLAVRDSEDIVPPSELPRLAIQQVEKDGRDMTVEVLSRDGQEGQRLSYTLPEGDSDYRLTAGNEALLRIQRRFDLIQFTVEAEAYAGVDVEGRPTGRVAVSGPVSFNVDDLRTLPTVAVDSESGLTAGVTVQWEF